MRAEVHALMRFWLDKGVAGFRMDVIDLISKPRDADGHVAKVFVPGPHLAEYLLEMKHQVLDRYDTLTVGEAPSADPALARLLTDQDSGALDMLFQFEHVCLDQHATKWDLKPLDLRDFKRSLFRWQEALAERGWNSLYLGNHDQPRMASRFGDGSPACGQVPGAAEPRAARHALRVPGRRDRHDELPVRRHRRMPRHRDAELLARGAGRTRLDPGAGAGRHPRQGPRQRPHADAMERRARRRLHAGHAVAGGEPEPRHAERRRAAGRRRLGAALPPPA